jgi:DNA-binding beta-propeller fold protein YncE
MQRIAMTAIACSLALVAIGGDGGMAGGETTLEAVALENGCVDVPFDADAPDWGSARMLGGDLAPLRAIQDPYPSFHGVAVDPKANRAILADTNRSAVYVYERTAASTGGEVTPPLTFIRGPATGLMFVASVAIDPDRQEIYAVDNDTGDRVVVFGYGDEGNARPRRLLEVPHQAWGLSINPKRGELAVTVQSPNEVVVYRRDASGRDEPRRVLRGPQTGMADPHGVVFDAENDEIFVANHGHRVIGRVAREAPVAGGSGYYATDAAAGDEQPGGRFEQPSITVYAGSAEGDTPPVRRIRGTRTRLDWPSGILVDSAHDEIVVANNGDDSVLVFARTAAGDVAPVRVLTGAATMLSGPMGVAVDTVNDELWVTNFSDHTALVFARTASGNAAPKRIIRNAPKGTPSGGFGNPGALAYDSKRDEILVPN